MKTLAVFFISTIFISKIESANILGVFSFPGKSHYGMAERLLKRLAEIGHNVDVLTHFPSKELQPRYHELSLAGTLTTTENIAPANTLVSLSVYDMMEIISAQLGVNMCQVMFNTSLMQDLKESKKKYDLVITQLFGTDCMIGFGNLFQAPTIYLISSMMLPWAADRIDNPDNPSYIPNYFVPFTNQMTLYERIENTISLWFSKCLYHFNNKKSDQISRKYFGRDLPPLEELTRNTSLILVNSHFSFLNSRPNVPNLIEVGGLHIQKPKSLSKYFENLLTTDTKGIILLTMGSMVLTENFEYDKLQGMFDAFAELPYKVLWKAKKERFPKGLKIPENIHFENWMPQLDILCHPKTKIFISHGGMFSTQEAIYCGVPRLGIPFVADQVNNIRAAEKLEIGIKVKYKDITKETILTAARKLLGDSSYENNCERISKQFKDRPLSPLDTAVYWVEYVLKHKGAPQLRSVGVNVSWYQYYLLDVIFVILLTLTFFGIVVVIVLKTVLVLLRKKTIGNTPSPVK